MRTPEQAEQALAAGVSLAAIGQGLVMNPDWVKYAKGEAQSQIALDVAAPDVVPLAIPEKLWRVIGNTPGWFNVRPATGSVS